MPLSAYLDILAKLKGKMAQIAANQEAGWSRSAAHAGDFEC